MDMCFVFKNTNTVILAEKLLLDAGILVTVRPLAASISKGCGLSLCLNEAMYDKALSILKANDISVLTAYDGDKNSNMQL